MSASNTGPGGVRNLRAMFENKASDQSSSPPSRGRSPNGSVSSIQDGSSSKVRASFVAVDKLGETARAQSIPRKASDATMDSGSENVIAEEQDLGEILKGSPFIDEGGFQPLPEPRKQSDSNGVADRAAAMVKKMQEGNIKPLPVTDSEYTGPKLPRSIKPPGSGKQSPEEAAHPPESSSTGQARSKGPIVKPRGGGAKILGVMESAAEARRANAATAAGKAKAKDGPSNGHDQSNATSTNGDTPSSAVPDTKRSIPRASGITPASKEQRADAVKTPTSRAPRTSLPTRKLPTAATAPTASSVAKKDDTKTAEAGPADKKATRVPPRVANVTTASSLAKKSSRASLNANEESKTRTTTKPANEGFLARMMRPTASSAQKTHEKVQVHSPPRPKPSAGKTVISRPSRKSLSHADENTENEHNAPPVPAVPAVAQEDEATVEPAEPQQAEGSSMT